MPCLGQGPHLLRPPLQLSVLKAGPESGQLLRKPINPAKFGSPGNIYEHRARQKATVFF